METPRHWMIEIIVYTRHWIHYGTVLFAVTTILTAAAKGLLIR
jgi:hypothetical protein